MNFIWISEQMVIISLYCIKWLFFITEMDCVCCETWTEYLNTTEVNVRLWRVKHHSIKAFGVGDVSLYTSLSSVVVGGDWSASHPSLFYPWPSNDDLLIVWSEPTTSAIPSSFTSVTTHPRRHQLWFVCIL